MVTWRVHIARITGAGSFGRLLMARVLLKPSFDTLAWDSGTMKTLSFGTLLAVAFTVAVSSPAAAQYYGGGTVASSRAHGMADVVRSAGDYNLRTAQAATEIEAAKSANMKNRLEWTETYFEQRKMNRAYRNEERGQRLSREQLFRIAKDQAPSRLNSSRLDPITGDLAWPLVLRDSKYTAYRTTLNDLFKSRNSAGGRLTPDAYREILSTCDTLMKQLNKNIRDYPANDWSQSKKFIESLKYEARFMAN
jgi:hypothetical protein